MSRRKGLRWNGRKLVKTWRDPVPWREGDTTLTDSLKRAGYSTTPDTFGEEHGYHVEVYESNEGLGAIVLVSTFYCWQLIRVDDVADLFSLLAWLVPTARALDEGFNLNEGGTKWVGVADIETKSESIIRLYNPSKCLEGIEGGRGEFSATGTLVPWSAIERVSTGSIERRPRAK